MTPTEASCRAIFRAVAQMSHHEWLAYDSTQLYDRSSLAQLKENIHTVAREWFDHDAHESVDQFVCHFPLEYVEFDLHDRYTDSTQYWTAVRCVSDSRTTPVDPRDCNRDVSSATVLSVPGPGIHQRPRSVDTLAELASAAH